jgi:4-hydroxy-tetrahydrodipicolinate synthase
MNSLNKINGSVFTIFTFFKKNLNIDYSNISSYIDFLYRNGARVFYMMPYNGRYSQLTNEEIMKLNIFCIKKVKSKKNTIIIVSDPIHASSEIKLKFAIKAKNHGADFFSSICREKYFSDAQIINHYKIMSKAGIPILVHVMPFLSGFDASNTKWPISLIKSLSNLKNVLAIKEDTKNTSYGLNLIKKFNNKIKLIFAGRLKFIHNLSKNNIVSFINGISLIEPKIDLIYLELCKRGLRSKAKQFIKKIDDPFWEDLVKKYGWHRCNKAILEVRGFGKRYERSPMYALNRTEFNDVRKFYKKHFKIIKNELKKYDTWLNPQ